MMKCSIGLILLLSLGAFAQDSAKSQESAKPALKAKTINLTGVMSADGRVRLSDSDSQLWTVSNPETLKSFVGQEVMIRCQVLAEDKELRVISVKRLKSENEYARWSDSAFRR